MRSMPAMPMAERSPPIVVGIRQTKSAMRTVTENAEAAIVGLADERWGEAPYAFVVLREGASATEADIIAVARERLAHFKAPRAVTFVDELPKTGTGKIQKFVLRKGAPNITHQ